MMPSVPVHAGAMALDPTSSLRRGASLLAALALTAWPGAGWAADLLVSAAASLTQAFRELAPGYEARHPGVSLRFNFAASDALLAQIGHGAPVDVFAAADQESMDRAEAQQLIVAGSRRDFAANRLVLVRPAGAGARLASLPDLARPEIARIALGKPEGVPAGRYARRALEAARLWPAVAPKAVYANNVRQVLDYVARGEADAGFVYATDAAVLKDRVVVVAAVPTALPIRYPVAVVAQGPNPAAASSFVDYLLTPAGQAVLARYGFGGP